MRVSRVVRAALGGMAVASMVMAGLGPTAAVAQDFVTIKLEAPDGSVSIEGRLLGIENGFYVIETSGANKVYVQTDQIKCVSLICPA